MCCFFARSKMTFPGVPDEPVRLAVQGAVAHLQCALVAAKEEGQTYLEGEAELKQQEEVSAFQEGDIC